MSGPSLLALASAANEAAIAYTEAIDSDISYLRETKDIGLARVDLLEAVDALTSAVVEAENDRPSQGDSKSGHCCPGGCDCSCCYGYPDRDCHCFTYPCNCGGGPAEHGHSAPFLVGEDSE